MRKIEYIFIDSDTQNSNRRSGHHAIPNLGYHYVVNSEGLVLKGRSSECNPSSLGDCRVATELGIANPIDISQTVNLIQGPIYDRDKYNKCAISIRYCGSLLPHIWLTDPDASCAALALQRAALLQLLVKLRKHFPNAKILGVSELDGKELYTKNIIVSDSMNVLRKSLSDLP